MAVATSKRDETVASVLAKIEPDSDGNWHCSEQGCEFTSTIRRGLARHLNETHGYLSEDEDRRRRGLRPKNATRDERRAQGSPPQSAAQTPKPRESTFIAQSRAELREVVEPIKRRLRDLNKRIEEQTDELAQMRELRRQYEATLKQLDPTSFVSKADGRRSQTAVEGARAGEQSKRDKVRQYVEEHADELRDGFTIQRLHEQMQAAGFHGQIGPSVMRAAVEDMRDAGIVRADRIVKGGGMRFLLTSNGRQADGT